MRAAAAVLILLAGCTPPAASERDEAGAKLEQAAITTGVIRDPAGTEIAGLYSRDTDRVCIVPAKGGGYRIGASIDYGAEGCSASGSVTRSGENLRVEFAGAPGCSFDARLDQDKIVFPGRVPVACDRLCTDRASFAALEADLLSDAASEAAQLRDAKGRPLCGS